ncbi:MAG: protein translocase subunit SecD [Patescibacteria group bacterium]|jgi:protein-export membrane protein SecD
MANILESIIRPGERGKVRWVFVLILILALGAGRIAGGNYYNKGTDWLAAKTNNSIRLPKIKEFPFRLGLDLQGGTHLVYQANVDNIASADRANALSGVRDVIERRINVFGVSEPVVQTNRTGAGEYQVVVELAGVKDVNEAIKMIGETPILEFKEEKAGGSALTADQKKQMDDYNKKAEAKAAEALGKVMSGGDFSALAKQYSEDPDTKDKGGDMGWITEKDQPEIAGAVKNLAPGKFTNDLVKTAGGFEILKLEAKRDKKNPFNEQQTEKEVKASHILICFKGATSCTSDLSKEDALKKIKELKAQANPKNFSELAKKNSTEPGASASGGSLGWFSSGQMVKAFEDTAMNQKVGTISDPVETEFGYHIIFKEAERPITEYNIKNILVRTKSEADYTGGQTDWKNTELTGKNLSKAVVQFDPNDNTPQVALEFDDEGGKMFAEITKRNVGKPVAIFLDGYPISVPTVNEEITGGKAQISGKFSITEAKLLAQRLNAGALPVPINLISQETVGASLGQESIRASLDAGLIAFLLVAFFMIIFYRFPGLLAVFALTIYSLIVMAIFKLWPVTLTLAGLAGFIMSIGMAVDANVLIFARLREELRKGKPLDVALEEGFMRAWPSIRDSNFFTIITCVILILFTTSVVKGFAVTLIIGVAVSMFSAIIITKNFLRLIPASWLEKKNWLIGVHK